MFHATMRIMAMTPMMNPRMSPAGNSRSTMRHQSPRRTSPSAMARMISDVACDPELPPELMTSGMNCERNTASSRLCS